MKTCSKCGVEKELSEFYWRKDHNAPRANCKGCSKATARQWVTSNLERHNASTRAWRLANPEKAKASVRAWELANPERHREARRKWQREHPETARAYVVAHREQQRANAKRRYATDKEKHREYSRAWAEAHREKERERSRQWYAKNPDWSVAKTQRRHAAKLKATPAWADNAAIDATYTMAVARTNLTGIKHHVDHIVPLKHPLVQGLHVEYNLQIIPAVENIKKGNRYWPDMPTEMRT